MAKATEVRGSGKQSEMTVMVLQIKGSDEMLREGLKAFETFASKMSQRVVAIPAPQNGTGAAQFATALDANQMEADLPIDAEDEILDVEAKPKKKATYTEPKPVAIDMSAGAMPFRNYVSKFNETDHNTKRCLIIASWFRDFAATPSITIDHVYTAYRFMGWGVRADIGKQLRNTKKQTWLKSDEPGTFALTYIGEEQLRKMTKVQE